MINNTLKYLFLLFLLLVVFQTAPGKSCNQKAYLHLNKSVYSSGEEVIFKAYLMNANTLKPDTCCKIIYISLSNSNNLKIMGFAVNLANGVANSWFNLPDTLSSGYYCIKAFTNDMRNFNHKYYFAANIVVINQGTEDIQFLKKPETFVSDTNATINTSNVIIDLNKYEYSTREKVSLKIKLSDNVGDVSSISTSISISLTIPDSSNVNNIINPGINYNSDDNVANNVGICYALPENKNTIVTGKVITNSGIPCSNVSVFLSSVDSILNFKYCNTDSNGRYFFQLNPNYNNRDIVVQTFDNTNQNIKIEPEDKYNDEPRTPDFEEYVNPGLKSFLLCVNKANLAKRALNQNYLEKTGNKENNKSIRSHFCGKPDVRVFPSDFSELENFKEIIENIVPAVSYHKTKYGFDLRIMDRETQTIWNNSALIFLNGIPFPDPNLVAALDSRQIKYIALKYNKLYYGDWPIYGIVAIKTNKHTISINPKNQTYQFFNEFKNEPCRIKSDSTSTNKNFPVLKQTLLWEPSMLFENDGTASYDFYTADLTGDFLINIQGFTPDGKMISGQTTIRIHK